MSLEPFDNLERKIEEISARVDVIMRDRDEALAVLAMVRTIAASRQLDPGLALAAIREALREDTCPN